MNTYEKILLASLGILGVSAKEVKRTFASISKKKLSSKEWEKTFSSLVKEGKVGQKEASKKIKSALQKALKELDIPTRNELQKLENKVNKLAKK